MVGGTGIFTSITGSSPNRIFNIEWRTSYYSDGSSANYELRLYEGQTRFDVIYGTVSQGNTSATAGVQKNDTTFDQYFCNGSGGAATGGQSYMLPTCGTPTPTRLRRRRLDPRQHQHQPQLRRRRLDPRHTNTNPPQLRRRRLDRHAKRRVTPDPRFGRHLTINMPLTGTSGVEDRNAAPFLAVFTFDVAVTSGNPPFSAARPRQAHRPSVARQCGFRSPAWLTCRS